MIYYVYKNIKNYEKIPNNMGNNVFADGSVFDDIIDSGKKWTEMGENSADNSEIDIDEIWEPMLQIAKALTIVGFVVVIVKAMLLIPSLKGDSPREQKEAKQKIVEFVVIAVLLAGSYKIWAFLLEMLDKLAEASDIQ